MSSSKFEETCSDIEIRLRKAPGAHRAPALVTQPVIWLSGVAGLIDATSNFAGSNSQRRFCDPLECRAAITVELRTEHQRARELHSNCKFGRTGPIGAPA
jgi:hypothetical protein